MLKNLKKALSVVLAFCMIMSMLSMTALADDNQADIPADEEVTQGENNNIAPAEPAGEGDDADESDGTEGGNTGETGTGTGNTEGTGTGTGSTEGTGNEGGDTVDPEEPKTPETPEKPEFIPMNGGPNGVVKFGDVYALYFNQETVNADQVGTLLHWAREENGYTGSQSSTSLFHVVIGPNVSTIADRAFRERGFLSSVNFAEDCQVTTIGVAAFEHCPNLNNVTIPASVTTIKGWAFNDASLANLRFEAGSRLTTIGDRAFANVPDDSKVYTEGFPTNDKMTSIDLPDSVTTIGVAAFHGRQQLTSVHIPDGVDCLGKWAFHSCTSLAEVTFGENSQMTATGVAAFQHCSALKSIDLPKTVTTISEYSFSCSGLKAIDLPGSVSTIEGYAFESCKGLTGLILPEGVKDIQTAAFQNCSLSYVEFPTTIEHITDQSFANNLLDKDSEGEAAGTSAKVKVVFRGEAQGYWSNSVQVSLGEGVSFNRETGKPTREGYQFVGWVEGEGETEQVKNGTTYHAEWECLHVNTTENTQPATCTEDGSTETVCDVCGELLDTGVITATGHSWSSYVTTRQPAVGVSGVATSTCTVCGNTRTRSIAALPEEPVSPVDPVDPADPEEPDDPIDIPEEDPPLSEEPDDPIDIPEEDPPLSEEPDDPIDIPEEDPPLSEEPDDSIDIPEEDPPLSEEPDDPIDIPEEEPPMAEQPSESTVKEQPAASEEDGEDIADSDVPLADVPQTGDGMMMWLGAAALSGAGLVLVTISECKRKEQDAE